MALTFEEYVSGRRRNEQTAGAGKLSFDDYVKMTPQQTAPQNDALMDLAMETVQAKTHNDNHDVLHGVAPATRWNPNPATDFYLRQKQNQQAEEIKKQQDALITQIKVIDRKRDAAKREANSGTTMQQRANLSGLANTAARENAQAYMEDKYANLRELDRQRAEMIDQLHAIGGKYGVGDFVGDFLDTFQAALQTPLATLDKTDYWASANAGLISPEDQAAYDRAHALENDIEQQMAVAKSGRGKAGQVVMDAAAAAGNVLGSTAFAYATGIPQAAQQVLGPVAANLSATEAQLGAKAGERVAAGAQRFAGNLIGDIVANPTNFAISAQSGIGAYDRAKTAGASETAAFSAALGNAAAEYFSNKMFSGTPLLDSPEEKGYVVELIEAAAEKAGRSGQVQALFNNGLVSYVFDKSGEGLEEVITGVLDPLIERLTYNPDADRATAEELFNEFIGGVAMSLLLGATEPVTNFQGRKTEARANEAAAAAYNAATGGASLESAVRELQRQGNMQTVEDLRPAYEAGARALDTAAKLTGVDTEGKTGMEIRRDVDAAAEAKKTAPLSDAEILNMALSENNKLSDDGKAVAREMYNLTRGEDTAPLDFIAGFNDVYDAARRGESPDSIQSEAAARLTPQARAAAYDAGLDAMRADTAERYSYSVRENDGEYTVVVHDAETGRDNPMQPVSTREEAETIINNFKGVTENAKSGSQGEIRDAGVPGREGRGGLRERAEKNRAWRETRKRDAEGIRNRIKAAGDGEEVSPKEAGISGGTDAKTMSIVRTYREADMRKMESEAAAHGIKVVFFYGEIEARKGGKTIKARGEYSADGKTFYVAVDDPDFTARQIFDHEDFHARAHTDAELQQICEDIIKGHSAAELQELVNAYVNTYGWTSMSDEEILQEILADAYAGIDVFQYLYSFEGATQFTEAVRGAVKAREGEQQTERGPPSEAKLSEKLTHDSEGRELTQEQAEYFKDSKVRDENGNLKVMYRGGTEDFTVFDRKKSSYANHFGRGFYFTDSKSHAGQYGKAKPYYLNITNPLSTTERTITKAQMRKFLEAVAENDEDFSFENYGYGATVDSVLNSVFSGKSDFSMIRDVDETAIGDMVAATELFNQINGSSYDGFILPTETVTFQSNQAKDVANKAPTENPDIRFSQKITPQQDADYSAAVERGDMETAQRMVDEAAKNVGYDIKVYRGGGQKHNVFDTKRGAGDTQFGPGTYFTDAYGLAQDWAKERAHTSDDNGYVGEYYIKARNLFSDDSTDFNTEQWKNVERALRDRGVSERELKRIRRWGFYGIAQALQSVGEIEEGSFTPYSWRNAPKVNQILREAGYDGIEAPFYDSRQYVIFDPTQVKSADPVTYDDNGNVIPLSERFNPENQDIRFSQKLTAEDELRQQNDELQKLVDYWRGQTKRTTAPAVRADDAEKVARDFVKSYNSKLDVKDAAAAVKALAEYIQSENVTWAEVKDRAYGIARDVVENAEALREGDGATYDEVKTALKKPLIISAQDAHDISPEWGAWRNANVGKVNVSINGKGTPVDVAYAELSERFPSLFPESITHPADQVQQMVDVVNELAPVYENPFSYNMAEAIEYCANDLIFRMYGENIRTAPPTFADKAAAQLEAEKARGAEKVARVREQKDAQIADLKARNAWATAQRIAEVRKQRDEKIAALKEHYAESRRTASERKADSAARTRLLKIIRRLNNKKLPTVNRAWLEEKIGDLDTVAKSITGETIMDLTRLRSWYDNQKANNPDFIADAATEAKIARLSQTQISDLTPSQVAELTEVLLNFENEINTQRKLIDSLDKRDTRQMVLESLYNVEETKGSKKNLVDWLVTNTLSPERLVKRLTGYAETDPLLMRTRELADGQRKMLDYQMRAEAKFKRWANDKKLMERLRSKERIKITGYYNGRAVEVEITPDMRMALYLHSLNDQNMKHIAKGGVTIPDIDTYLKGDIGEAYTRGTTVKLSPSNIRSIASGMSAEERAYAKAAHDYFNGMSKDEVNATSEKLVGYSIAGVDDYFPIETDRNFTKSDIAELKRDGTIEGMGFLKERVNAANAINLVPLTDVLNKSIKNHAKYVGLAIPVRNFSKVWGMNAHNDVASEDNGLRKAIGKKWGERGVDAIETMIADLQNSYHKADELDKMFSKIKSNYAGAVLTLNLSVAMKQAASYPTAAAVLGWGPVAKAMKDVGRVDLDLIAKYTPLQWQRSQGYSTPELGDIRSRGGIMDRVLGTTVRVKGRDVPLFNWIQTADLLTTRKLWKASEYYVQQHNADLRRGSEEYYTAVADIYNRVIEETQPNYTTMQRPQLLRSHSAWAEILGMFKTQPFQNFNILYDATAELAAAERAAKNGDKSRLAAARQNAKNAYTSQIASLALFAAMTAAYGFLRGRDDKWRNKEGEVTVGSVAAGIVRDMIGGLFSMVPGGSDVYNLGEAMATGGKYYGVSSVTVSALTDAGTAIYKAGTAISKAIEQANDPEKEVNVKALSKSMETLTLELSKALGVPAENIRNDVQIIMKTALNGAFGYYVGSYIMTRYTENMDSSYTKGDVYDLLYSAYLHDRSAYNELRRMMKEDGFTDKNMDAAIKKRSEKK